MKVCIIEDFVRPHSSGGASVYISDLIEHLQAKNITTVVITTSAAPQASTIRKKLSSTHYLATHLPNIPTYTKRITWWGKLVSSALYFYNPWVYRQTQDCLAREKPDIIHTFDTLYLSLAALRAAHTSSIPWVHTCLYTNLLSPVGVRSTATGEARLSWVWKLLLPLTRTIIGNPALVVAPSKATAELYRRYRIFQKSRMEILPLASALPVEKSVGAQASEIHFLCVSRFDVVKDVATLIKAFRKVPHGNARLTVCGSGNEEGHLRTLADGDQRITFAIAPKKISSFYAQADVLVSPTRAFETFNLVPAEALRAGLAVIASNVAANQEIVTPGVGLVFEVGNVEQLRDHMIAYITQPELLDEHQKNAALAGKSYGMEEHTEKVVDLYSKVVTA